MDTVPVSVWEQLAVVGAFIAFLGGVWGFIRWLLAWSNRVIGEQRSVWQNFMREQNAAWIASVKEQNERWQEWSTAQSERECASMKQVTTSLDKLTEKLAAHDEKVEERFAAAIDAVNKRPTRGAK